MHMAKLGRTVPFKVITPRGTFLSRTPSFSSSEITHLFCKYSSGGTDSLGCHVWKSKIAPHGWKMSQAKELLLCAQVTTMSCTGYIPPFNPSPKSEYRTWWRKTLYGQVYFQIRVSIFKTVTKIQEVDGSCSHVCLVLLFIV